MCLISITKCKTLSRFNVLKYLIVSVVLRGRGRFTFNSLFIVVLMYLVVPLYSHATKSTPISLKLHQTPKNHSTHIFGQNLTIPYPNSHLNSPQEPQQNNPSPHYLSTTPSNSPHSTQTLINPTQINKISPKTPYSYNTPVKNFPNPIPSTNPNKTLLKLRIIPHIPKISTLI